MRNPARTRSLVLSYLKGKSDGREVYATYREISSAVGMSVWAVQTAVAHLVYSGTIRLSDKGTGHTPNKYVLVGKGKLFRVPKKKSPRATDPGA